MIEFMLMSDQWIWFLNQSKLHQCMPFIVLSLVSCLSLVIFTDMSAGAILATCFNPLSFLVYFMVGVATFITLPVMTAFIALFFLMNYLANLKKTQRNNTHK